MKKLLFFSAIAISFNISHCMEENKTPRKKEFLATQKILAMVKTYIDNNQGKTSFTLENRIVETPYLGPYSPGTAQESFMDSWHYARGRNRLGFTICDGWYRWRHSRHISSRYTI